MRAWVPEKREHQPTSTGADGPPRRRARVRNRLLVGIALAALSAVVAGAPGLVTAGRTLSEDQELVELAELNRRTLTLAYTLADERDALLVHLARDRGPETGRAWAAERLRVDERARELRAQEPPKRIVTALDELARHRRDALSGDADVLAVHKAYTDVLHTLGDVAGGLARALPSRAQQTSGDGAEVAGPAEALPYLVRAVQHASATRGLLLAALAERGDASRTAAAAHRARVSEQAALAEFDQLAGDDTRDSLNETVNGPDVSAAERYLARLTDQPRLDARDRAVNRERLESTLTARVHLMRSVASTLSVAEAERLAGLRDDDVTALQLHLALVGGCLLLVAASGLHTARSVLRPLAVLRRGTGRVAADPDQQHPLGFTGRNDEFAEVARAFNRLHAHLRRRTADPRADQTEPTDPTESTAPTDAVERPGAADGSAAPEGAPSAPSPDSAGTTAQDATARTSQDAEHKAEAPRPADAHEAGQSRPAAGGAAGPSSVDVTGSEKSEPADADRAASDEVSVTRLRVTGPYLVDPETLGMPLDTSATGREGTAPAAATAEDATTDDHPSADVPSANEEGPADGAQRAAAPTDAARGTALGLIPSPRTEQPPRTLTRPGGTDGERGESASQRTGADRPATPAREAAERRAGPEADRRADPDDQNRPPDAPNADDATGTPVSQG